MCRQRAYELKSYGMFNSTILSENRFPSPNAGNLAVSLMPFQLFFFYVYTRTMFVYRIKVDFIQDTILT